MTVTALVAPAAFKGTFGPRQVADALVIGVRRALPEAVMLQCPISDGGGGLLDAGLPPRSFRGRPKVPRPPGPPALGGPGGGGPETPVFERRAPPGPRV